MARAKTTTPEAATFSKPLPAFGPAFVRTAPVLPVLLFLVLCLACLGGCSQGPAPGAESFAPVWDAPVDGLWDPHAFKGKVRLVSLVPYQAAIGKDGLARKLPPVKPIAKTPAYVSTEALLNYPLRVIDHPYVLDYGLWGLRAQIAYDGEGEVAWALHVEYAGGQPSRILVQVRGRKDLVYLDLEREAGSGRLLAAVPVGLDDTGSRLPLLSLSSCLPAPVEYRYDESGRILRIAGFEAASRRSGEPGRKADNKTGQSVRNSERFEKIGTSRDYTYDNEGRLIAVVEQDGAGTRGYSFSYSPGERRIYRRCASGAGKAALPEPDFKQYDAAGRLELHQFHYRREGADFLGRTEYRRDEQGRVTLARNTVSVPRGENSGKHGESSVEVCYQYDERGNMVRSAERRPGAEEADVRVYEYDERGNWTRAVFHNIGEEKISAPEPAVLERRVKYMPE